jgi:hypothetical protein
MDKGISIEEGKNQKLWRSDILDEYKEGTVHLIQKYKNDNPSFELADYLVHTSKADYILKTTLCGSDKLALIESAEGEYENAKKLSKEGKALARRPLQGEMKGKLYFEALYEKLPSKVEGIYKKLLQIESSLNCHICGINKKDVLLECNHYVCIECARNGQKDTETYCKICNKTIKISNI